MKNPLANLKVRPEIIGAAVGAVAGALATAGYKAIKNRLAKSEDEIEESSDEDELEDTTEELGQ